MMGQLNANAHAKSLMSRVADAAPAHQLRVQIGDWKPQEKMCHHNVTYFCEKNQEYQPVRGWLYFDLPGLSFAKFVSHSVIQAPDGKLYDITPSSASQTHPFLASNLSEDDYAELIEGHGASELHAKKLDITR